MSPDDITNDTDNSPDQKVEGMVMYQDAYATDDAFDTNLFTQKVIQEVSPPPQEFEAQMQILKSTTLNSLRKSFNSADGYTSLQILNQVRNIVLTLDHDGKKVHYLDLGTADKIGIHMSVYKSFLEKYDPKNIDAGNQRFKSYYERLKNPKELSRFERQQIEAKEFNDLPIVNLVPQSEILRNAILKISKNDGVSRELKDIFLDAKGNLKAEEFKITERNLVRLSKELIALRSSGKIELTNSREFIGAILDELMPQVLPIYEYIQKNTQNAMTRNNNREIFAKTFKDNNPEYADILTAMEDLSEEYWRIDSAKEAIKTVYTQIEAIRKHEDVTIDPINDESLLKPFESRNVLIRRDKDTYKSLRAQILSVFNNTANSQQKVTRFLDSIFVSGVCNDSTFERFEDMVSSFGGNIEEIDKLVGIKYYTQVKSKYFDGNAEFMDVKQSMLDILENISQQANGKNFEYESLNIDRDEILRIAKSKLDYNGRSKTLANEVEFSNYKESQKGKKYSKDLSENFLEGYEEVDSKVEKYLAFALINNILNGDNQAKANVGIQTIDADKILDREKMREKFNGFDTQFGGIEEYIRVVLESQDVEIDYKDKVVANIVPILNEKRKEKGEMPVYETIEMIAARIGEYRDYTQDSIGFLDNQLENVLNDQVVTQDEDKNIVDVFQFKIVELRNEISWYNKLKEHYSNRFTNDEKAYLDQNPLAEVELRAQSILDTFNNLQNIMRILNTIEKPNPVGGYVETILDETNILEEIDSIENDINEKGLKNITGNKDYGTVILELINQYRDFYNTTKE